ncbi:histidine phosphatase family protein [Ottowia thiooxydans]|uniref:histidine phosphatase family protein n=1 Tax=Ottowia thiooxydans TaxID=219182 RepID=UPI000409C1B7|nr:histidine phosphatase family protein [Ottowia thiooxydans]
MNNDSRLLLVRHAPVLIEKGVCYGATDLPADGAANAEAAARLAERVPEGLVVRVSPLLRCQQLARSLQALRPDLSFSDDPRLREMDFGAWEGKPWADIPQAEFDRWLSDFSHARPGGEGETVAALMDRVAQAWSEWCSSEVDALWITHAGVMRASILLSKGVNLPATAADWPAVDLPFGQTLELRP